MVEIEKVYAEKIRMYVDGNIDRALLVPEAFGGLDPKYKVVYDKLQDGEYRNQIINMIVFHIMYYNRIYDKENLDYEKRFKHYMEKVYMFCNEKDIANLAVACDAKLTEELDKQETHKR